MQSLANGKLSISLAKSKGICQNLGMARQEQRSACPMACALDLIGDRWTLLVVRDMTLMGKTRFSEFLESPEGIATNVLSDRLQRLQDSGIVISGKDPEDGRRVLYAMTKMGLDLLPMMLELAVWGAKHRPESGVPKELKERYLADKDQFLSELRERVKRSSSSILPAE